MVHQDWTVVYTTSSSSSSSSTTPLSSPFPSPTVDAHPFLLPVHITLTPATTTTTTTSNSNNVSYVSSHPITTTTTTTAKGTNTRPTLSRRNSPAENGVHAHAHNPLLSLVRPHEPIEIPIPPSLRAKKGMTRSTSSLFEGTTTLKPSSFSSSPSSYGSGSSGSSNGSSFGGRRAASAWYDYDEFGDAGSKAVFMSSSSSPSLPVPAGPCPVPRLPPSPLLHPTTASYPNMTPTQKYQACSPVPLLVLPGPVLRPTTTAATTTTRVSWA